MHGQFNSLVVRERLTGDHLDAGVDMDAHTPWRVAASTSGSPTSSTHSSAGATPHPERLAPRTGAVFSRSSSRNGSPSAPVQSPRSLHSDTSHGGIPSHRGSPVPSRLASPRQPSPLAHSTSPFSPAEPLLLPDSVSVAQTSLHWPEIGVQAREGESDSDPHLEDSELHTEGVPTLPQDSAPRSPADGSLLGGTCTPCAMRNSLPVASTCMVRVCTLGSPNAFMMSFFH